MYIILLGSGFPSRRETRFDGRRMRSMMYAVESWQGFSEGGSRGTPELLR
jgi:hypothetical protein